MISGLCELPAHTLLAAAPRSQPPARARSRAAALARRRRIWASRGADLVLGYRFRPPLFARARLPARASYRRWSPIEIRRSSSTPHPVNYASLHTQARVSQPPPYSLPGHFCGALGQKRALRVPGNVILQRAAKNRLNCHIWPQIPTKTPPHIPIADDGRQDTSPTPPNTVEHRLVTRTQKKESQAPPQTETPIAHLADAQETQRRRETSLPTAREQ